MCAETKQLVLLTLFFETPMITFHTQLSHTFTTVNFLVLFLNGLNEFIVSNLISDNKMIEYFQNTRIIYNSFFE